MTVLSLPVALWMVFAGNVVSALELFFLQYDSIIRLTSIGFRQ